MYEMMMKKLLLILCLFSMTALAEWKLNDYTNNYDSYIDFSRIKTEGRHKSLWELRDYKSPQTDSSGKQAKSMVIKHVIDCQGSRLQIVAVYLYSEQMSKGNVVDSEVNSQITESNWDFAPPNSISDGLIKVACGRK